MTTPTGTVDGIKVSLDPLFNGIGDNVLSMQAAWVGIPVKAVTVSDPPVTNMDVTIMLVANPKNMNVK
jgi:hypothetical protein